MAILAQLVEDILRILFGSRPGGLAPRRNSCWCTGGGQSWRGGWLLHVISISLILFTRREEYYFRSRNTASISLSDLLRWSCSIHLLDLAWSCRCFGIYVRRVWVVLLDSIFCMPWRMHRRYFDRWCTSIQCRRILSLKWFSLASINWRRIEILTSHTSTTMIYDVLVFDAVAVSFYHRREG